MIEFFRIATYLLFLQGNPAQTECIDGFRYYSDHAQVSCFEVTPTCRDIHGSAGADAVYYYGRVYGTCD